MADGSNTIKLSGEVARRLRAAADAAGRSVDDYASELISAGLDDWAEDFARLRAFDRTGESIAVEEALELFNGDIERRLLTGS